MKAICGLGNPGRKYRKTRHNLGFLALDRYARRYWPRGRNPLRFPRWRRTIPEALLYRPQEDLLLIKPLTYMNRSGLAVARVCKLFALKPENCLIVYDDVALPLGELRARARGSAGGHKGMASVIAALGTDELPRLRLGIGSLHKEKPDNLVEYVLSEFTSEEWPMVERMLDHAAEALDIYYRRGLQALFDFIAQLRQRPEPEPHERGGN